MTASGTLVVVSGAAGAIGGAVAEGLQVAGYRVRGVDLREGRRGVDEMFVGDCRDEDFALQVVDGAAALIHLAAQPSPDPLRPERTFLNNVPVSFALCHAAASSGVRRIIVASSISIYGMAYAPRDELVVPYAPVDELTPLQAADTYALGKAVDELALRMFERRFGTSSIALRMPFVSTGAPLNQLGRDTALDPSLRSRELWSYLDTRDAVHAFVRALESHVVGTRAFNVVSPASLGSVDVEHLLRSYLPSVEIRGSIFPGHSAYSTSLAKQLLSFTANWCWCGAMLQDHMESGHQSHS